MKTKLNFRVVSYANDKFQPHSVETLFEDQVQDTLTIGDYVTNGTKMKGYIEKFELSSDLQSLFVYTDWSGVGMNIESVYKINLLPSAEQINDIVKLDFLDAGVINDCEVVKVHFSESKVLYDVNVKMTHPKTGKPMYTRMYNIDSCFVSKP